MTRLSNIRKFGADEDGTMLVFWGVSFIVIFGIVALSFDLSRVAITQTELQSYADNVALAAAGELDGESDTITCATSAAANLIADSKKYGSGGDELAGATANEIWAIVRGIFPNDAAIANLSFNYSYDTNLGFLGGPYTPVVTVEVQNLDFEFVSPLADLVGLAGGTAEASLRTTVNFPAMSVSMPAEDPAQGNNG